MRSPEANLVISQFKPIFDNPDTQNLLAECWDLETAALTKSKVDMPVLRDKVELFMTRLYPLIHKPAYKFNFANPLAPCIAADLLKTREILMKRAVLTTKGKIPKEEVQEPDVNEGEAYKPFNIAEFDIQIIENEQLESKQDEILRMYQQLGLTY